MTTKEHEHTLNVWMAELLRERGLQARAERIQQRGRRIDVAIRVGRVRVALEAEQGQSNAKRNEAIRDADRRLEQGLADCAIAVCYPEGIGGPEQLQGSRVLWTIRVPRLQNTLIPLEEMPQWSEADLDELASIVRLAPMQLGNPDHVADSLSASLDSAVNRLDENQKRLLAQKLDLPAAKSTRGASRWHRAAKRGLLVVATAVMFHARLDNHVETLKPEYDGRATDPETPFTGDWPPNMARVCADDEDPTAAFLDAWNLILALDYRPIFETGRAALGACPPDPAFTGAIRDTARAALRVVANIAGLRHDLLGRIFHTVLDTARFDGSFYTTTAAATLLSSLAVTEEMCDWSDPAAVAELRIVDPACGTGTLLMASAERIRDLLSPEMRDDEHLARILIEQVLSGYDVNLTATHMAATTLSLLSPSTRFHKMQVGRTFLGVDGEGDAYLGSLEFLEQRPKLMSWPNTAQLVSQVDSGEEMSRVEPSDLVIMNPPFTRDSLRHDQFSREDEEKLKEREKRLFADKPTYMAGGSGAFLFLAEYINKKSDVGTLAVILPLVGATDVSGLGIRKFLASRYHVDTIVTSHDPERIYFSENTSIGEMLLICRRWPDLGKPKPSTHVVNLTINPSTPADAVSVARAIQNGTVETQGYGTVQEWKSDLIAGGDWGAVQFLSPYLCERFLELDNGNLFGSVELGDVAWVGPEGRRIRDAYRRSDLPSVQGRMALWMHDTEVTQSMFARPDTHIVAKPDKTHLADRYWQQKSTLLLTQRARLNTVRLFSVRTDVSVVGSSWVSCRPTVYDESDKTLEKAICAYLNSSVGILAILGNRTNRVPSYPRFSIDDLRKLSVPDFSVIGDSAVWMLALAYDSLAEQPLAPLPQMDSCDTRRALDDLVCAALNIDPELVATIRRHLAAEPSVTGQRFAPL